ncbi:MAG: ATP synthase F1 subunit delta [Clostridia bacterium]
MVVSNRYASSLFDIALGEKCLNEVFSDLNDVTKIISENTELYSVLSAPNINVSDKIAIFEKLFKGKIQAILYNFIAILIEKKRVDLFFEIKDEFTEIYNNHKNILKAKVTTAAEIDEPTKASVLAKIKAKTGREVELECVIDPEILGGIIIKYDNTLLDGSVKTRLSNLNEKIKEVGV